MGTKLSNNKVENKIMNNYKKYNQNWNEINRCICIAKDSFAKYIKGNTFCVFKSIYDIFYLIYRTKNNSIIFYNLIDNKKINEIKNAHKQDITNFRHNLDNYSKRDLILSLSLIDNNIKLWNVNNYECLLNIEKVNKEGGLLSACFLNYNKQIYYFK